MVTNPDEVVGDDTEDYDDRLMHMMSITNEPEEVTTTQETESSSSGQTTYYTETFYVAEPTDDDNYHISNFHSDVKRAVYPDPQTDKMINYGVLFLMSLIVPMLIIKLIIIYFKHTSMFNIPDYKMKAIYSLLRDIAILMFVLCIALLFHYHSQLDFYHTNLERLLYGVYIFLMIWIGAGILLLYVSYFRISTYFSYESISTKKVKLDQLKRIYEELHANDPNSVPSGIYDQVEFQLLRQSFINPIELPVLTESFLRRDFNFSKYLGYCLTDSVSSFYLLTSYSFPM